MSDANQLGPRDLEILGRAQREAFRYFESQANPDNGLVADSNAPGASASIAALGLGLSCYAVGVERGFMSRGEAVGRVLAALRFLNESEQSRSPDATGYKGFYYHFLDMKTGRRAGSCELSTIDTALLMAGVLTVASYFDRTTDDERELRDLADALYRRVDWAWAADERGCLGHGWRPKKGRLRWSWNFGYSEASILYALALGSPTFSIPNDGYREWTATFEKILAYEIEYIYAGPLFIHQLPQVWLDLRDIRDELNRTLGFDYFENSRRATLVHRAYATDNPQGFAGYSANTWGLTASDGPGPAVKTIAGKRRRFFGYRARGAPFGPDDGTIAPWGVLASLPFAPRVVCDAAHHEIELLDDKARAPSFQASINPTFTTRGAAGWVAPWKLGLNEGPIVLMIENFSSQLVWKLARRCPYIVRGLERAGFEGGWLREGTSHLRSE